jgi:hypothetical protein
MKQRVDFPDGTYAMFREKVNVRGRKVMERTSIPAVKAMRRIRSARQQAEIADGEPPTEQEQVSYTESEIEAMQRFEMAGVVAMLAHWTKEDPLPRTIEDVEEMDPDDLEVLAAAVRPHLWDLLGRPKVGPDDAVGDNGRPDMDSPTGLSNGSSVGESPKQPETVVESQVVTSETSTETSSPPAGSTTSGDAIPA